jgi:hypothetical protein
VFAIAFLVTSLSVICFSYQPITGHIYLCPVANIVYSGMCTIFLEWHLENKHLRYLSRYLRLNLTSSHLYKKVKVPLLLTNLALRHEDVWGSGSIDPYFLDVDTSWR